MPQPGLRWRFITINTKNSWHHGSPRGFRSRGHRIHSNGDYRNPPPPGEHERLLRYRKERADEKVVIPESLRPTIADAIVAALSENYRFKALSVSSDHAHLLIELPDDPRRIKTIIGEAKRHSSREVRDVLPGALWSSGCDYTPIDDEAHFKKCEMYTLFKQGHGSWTWSPHLGAMWQQDRMKLVNSHNAH